MNRRQNINLKFKLTSERFWQRERISSTLWSERLVTLTWNLINDFIRIIRKKMRILFICLLPWGGGCCWWVYIFWTPKFRTHYHKNSSFFTFIHNSQKINFNWIFSSLHKITKIIIIFFPSLNFEVFYGFRARRIRQ